MDISDDQINEIKAILDKDNEIPRFETPCPSNGDQDRLLLNDLDNFENDQ